MKKLAILSLAASITVAAVFGPSYTVLAGPGTRKPVKSAITYQGKGLVVNITEKLEPEDRLVAVPCDGRPDTLQDACAIALEGIQRQQYPPNRTTEAYGVTRMFWDFDPPSPCYIIVAWESAAGASSAGTPKPPPTSARVWVTALIEREKQWGHKDRGSYGIQYDHEPVTIQCDHGQTVQFETGGFYETPTIPSAKKGPVFVRSTATPPRGSAANPGDSRLRKGMR